MADKLNKPEEVGYGLIGEDHKLPNEVGYNINGEITKDASAIENANNQTTTGMAGQIPGINSPKLFANTSIIGGAGGGGGQLGELEGRGTAFPSGDFSYFNIWNVTIASTDVSLNPSYPSRIYIREGLYLVYCYINISRLSDFFYSMWCGATRIVRGTAPSTFEGEVNFTTVCKAADGDYISVGITPNGNANSARCTVRVVKLS